MIELGAFYSQIEAGIKEKGFTLDEALCEAKNHSIDWVDVNADYFYKIPPKEFAQNLKKHGIGISSVHGLTVCDVSSDEKIDESIRCMKEQMEFAKMAGSKFFMIVPQPAQSYREDMKGELEEGVKKADAKKRAAQLLEIVGLPDKANSYPAQLSGGQQQRIAIARALATEPEVLLCDEATSALDPKTTHAILELIKDINKKLGITVIVITHQMSVVEEICNRVAILDGGAMAEEGLVTEVFSNPQSSAAKHLVYPDGLSEILPDIGDGKVLRVIFDGALAAGSPLITQMAIDEGIAANILYASTRCMDDKVYGTMLLGLVNDEGIIKRATQYLQACKNVIVKEEERND